MDSVGEVQLLLKVCGYNCFWHPDWIDGLWWYCGGMEDFAVGGYGIRSGNIAFAEYGSVYKWFLRGCVVFLKRSLNVRVWQVDERIVEDASAVMTFWFRSFEKWNLGKLYGRACCTICHEMARMLHKSFKHI